MTIAELGGKCKNAIVSIPRDMLVIAVLIFASTLSFGLGYLAGRDAGQGSGVVLQEPALAAVPTEPGSGQVIASKNGTKYYLPGCAGADRISKANVVRFASPAAAAAAGYALAANCKGI